MLTVTDLSVDYGSTRVVDAINLALGDDEILMLVGPTGCGKTTILHALAGLIPISGGTIELGHWQATPKRLVPPEKRNVGMVFQDFALFPHLSVQQNVCFRLKHTEQADYWLQLLGLDAFRDAKPDRLSGGQKQRVALARTLAHEPDFVLLDEPLSNLDAALKDSLRWEIRQALKAAGVPAIWVTHDQDEALSVGDRVGVLNHGVLAQIDTPEQCFSKPASRFVARFLGDASFIPGHRVSEQPEMVHTAIGTAPGIIMEPRAEEVDLLLRPDDIALTVNGPKCNGKVDWVRFEGGTRLCAVTLDSSVFTDHPSSTPVQLKIRVSHENEVQPDDRVQLVIHTTHPLAAYARDPG